MGDTLKCGCVIATANNTAFVKKGFEMGGYVKRFCAEHGSGDSTLIGPKPQRAGRNWTEDEEGALITQLRAGATVDALAEIHERSLSAIITRLERMGLVYNVGGLIFKAEDLWADTRRFYDPK